MRRGLALALLALVCAAPGCSDDCCRYDGHPIPLLAGPDGALYARLGGDSTGFLALVDTATPINLWDGAPGARRLDFRTVALHDGGTGAVVRARFRELPTLTSPLRSEGAPGPVRAVLGGEFLRRFSFTLAGPDSAQGGHPWLSVWSDLPVSSDFLAEAGYAVLGLDNLGGGQIEAQGKPDFFGQRAPYDYPATRLMLRACVAPDEFDPDAALPRCCAGDDRRQATGADVTLLLATGWGPLVLSEAAWTRVAARTGVDAAESSGTLSLTHPTLSAAVMARRVTVPRMALVDRELPASDDAGPCVDLGRARRLEQVARSQARSSAHALCAEPCDQDPRSAPSAHHGAAYIELNGEVEIAVVPDGSPFLQLIRMEIRPDGPELDGLLGAAALKSLRFDLDYRPQPARLVASCLPSLTPARCRAVGRCPRLPRRTSTRVCYGLPEHGLPELCDNRDSCQ